MHWRRKKFEYFCLHSSRNMIVFNFLCASAFAKASGVAQSSYGGTRRRGKSARKKSGTKWRMFFDM